MSDDGRSEPNPSLDAEADAEVRGADDVAQNPIEEPSTHSPFDPWTKRGAIIGAVGIVVGTLVAFGIYLLQRSDKADEVVPQQAASSVAATAPRVASSACVTDEGQSAACAQDKAWLIVKTTSCATDSILPSLGLDAQLDQLLISTRVISGKCVVRPLDSGLSAVDVERTQSGIVAPGLRECLSGFKGESVPCSEVHTIEWVSAWMAEPVNPTVSCLTTARLYASRSFADPGDPLSARVATRTSGGLAEVRCLIVSSKPLQGSLRKIANGELPVTRTN